MIGRFHQREGRLWKMHAHFTSIPVNKAWVMFTAENFYCLAELHGISCISFDWHRTSLNTSILKFFIIEVYWIEMEMKEQERKYIDVMETIVFLHFYYYCNYFSILLFINGIFPKYNLSRTSLLGFFFTIIRKKIRIKLCAIQHWSYKSNKLDKLAD